MRSLILLSIITLISITTACNKNNKSTTRPLEGLNGPAILHTNTTRNVLATYTISPNANGKKIESLILSGFPKPMEGQVTKKNDTTFYVSIQPNNIAVGNYHLKLRPTYGANNDEFGDPYEAMIQVLDSNSCAALLFFKTRSYNFDGIVLDSLINSTPYGIIHSGANILSYESNRVWIERLALGKVAPGTGKATGDLIATGAVGVEINCDNRIMKVLPTILTDQLGYHYYIDGSGKMYFGNKILFFQYTVKPLDSTNPHTTHDPKDNYALIKQY